MPFAEVIMNPSAGKARWKKQLPELVAIIESHFAPLHISQTRKAGDARLVTERLIMAYQHKMDDLQLIVIGGDGTLHDVVNGCSDKVIQKSPLAMCQPEPAMILPAPTIFLWTRKKLRRL